MDLLTNISSVLLLLLFFFYDIVSWVPNLHFNCMKGSIALGKCMLQDACFLWGLFSLLSLPFLPQYLASRASPWKVIC